jgi:homoserine kinase
VGNVAVGFDLLGFCFDVAGDRVTVEKIAEPGVVVCAATPGASPRAMGSGGRAGLGAASGALEARRPALPSDPALNTAAAGLMALGEDFGLAHGFAVSIEKGIALGSGMGGSAASAVASIVAASALLEQPLTQAEKLTYALIGESVASGSLHPDNVAPCLLGGLTLARLAPARGLRPVVEVASIPIPAGIWCALAKPGVALETRAARAALGKEIPLRDHVRQSGLLAGFIVGCYENNFELIASSLADVVVEPQRAGLIAGFAAAKSAALGAGALGCSIAGAGPSVFAWARGEEGARSVARAMGEAFARSGSATETLPETWVAPLPSRGARLVE